MDGTLSPRRIAGAPYVVVDFHEDALAAAREGDDHFIEGNATDDDDLRALDELFRPDEAVAAR